MESWPSFLPRPQTAGYSIQPETQVVANRFDAGPPVQRLRFDDQIDYISVTWDFSDYQLALFKEWFATKLSFGTKKFTMLLNIGGLDGDQTYECEFESSGRPYSVAFKVPGYWTVTARLFVEEVEFADEAILDILIEEYPATGTAFIAAVDRLDNFVETNLTD